MATDVLLVKNLNRLEAAEPITADTLKAMKQGEVVTATLRRARNPQHHRKFFALLNAIYESQNRYSTMGHLLAIIKVYTGYYDIFPVNGKDTFFLKSISFASMDQTEFESFYDHVVNIILKEIVPGIDKADLERRVLEIIGDKQQ